MFKVGDLVRKEGRMEALVIERSETEYTLYAINGLYQMIVDRSSLKLKYTKTKTRRENVPKERVALSGYNLYYDLEENTFLDFSDAEIVGNVNEDAVLSERLTKDFFELLRGCLADDCATQGYGRISEMLSFSKAFSGFGCSSPDVSFVDYEIGDIFSDNLKKSDFFHREYVKDGVVAVDRDFFKSNYWCVVKESDFGFLAVHVETQMIFHFNERGEATHFVNDIDNRWTYPFGTWRMTCNALEHYMDLPFSFQQDFDKQKNPFYKLVEITKDHFFHGLRLDRKMELSQKELGILGDVMMLKVKALELRYDSPRSWKYREQWISFMYRLKESLKHEKVDFYHDNLDDYDREFTLGETELSPYYRFAFDHYYEKTKISMEILKVPRGKSLLHSGVLQVDGVEYIEGCELEKDYKNFVDIYKKAFKRMAAKADCRGYWLVKFKKEFTRHILSHCEARYPYSMERIVEDLSIDTGMVEAA